MSFEIENGVLKKYEAENGETEVVIPDSVTTIGDWAFAYCSSLTTVTIPDLVTTIGDWAFYGCESLTSVTIPDSVTTIGEYAFCECSRFKSIIIPCNVKKIGYNAFSGCINLESITIPEGIKIIHDTYDNNFFSKCSKLAEINVSEKFTELIISDVKDTKWYKKCTDEFVILGANLLKYKGNDENVVIPENVINIDEEAFNKCPKLKSVILPDSVKTISEDAFRNCKKLTEFITPDGLGKVDDMTVKKFILPNWEKFTPALNAEIFLNKHSKALLKLYTDFKGNRLNEMGNAIVDILSNKPSAKICNSAADYLTMYYNSADSDILKAIFEALKSAKTGENAVETIKANAVVMQKIGAESSSSKMNPAEMKILQENSDVEIEKKLKEYYTLEMSELGVIKDKKGKKLNPVVLAWLLVAHEKKIGGNWSNSNDIEAEYKKPGVCPKAKEVLELIDNDSLQKV